MNNRFIKHIISCAVLCMLAVPVASCVRVQGTEVVNQVKANQPEQPKNSATMNEVSDMEEIAIEDTASVVKGNPIMEDTPIVEEAPITGKASIMKDTPIVEETPITGKTSIMEDTPDMPDESDVSEYLYRYGSYSPLIDDTPDIEISDDESLLQASQSVYDYLYEKLKAGATDIDMSIYYSDTAAVNYEDTKAKMKAIYSGVLNEHPDLLSPSGGYSFYRGTSGGCYYITRLLPVYNNKVYDWDALDSAVNKALSVIEKGMTDEEKIIALHDYIVLNCKYDKTRLVNQTLSTEHPDAYNMYGVLVDREAVCQGYAEAYKYLLGKVGVTAYMVSSSNINHAWNVVVVDGVCYQIDTTWDDPTYDRLGLVGHGYMLNSDSVFGHLNSAGVQDWIITANSVLGNYASSSYKATNTKYDSAYWRNVISSLLRKNGYYYYINSNCNIVKIPTGFNSSNKPQTIFSNIGRWMASSGGYWIGAFSNLYDINGKIYYNTPYGINSVDYDGKNNKIVYTAPYDSSTLTYVYGSVLWDDTIYYSLEDYPVMYTDQVYYKGPSFEKSAVTLNEASILADGAVTLRFKVTLSDDLTAKSNYAIVDGKEAKPLLNQSGNVYYFDYRANVKDIFDTHSVAFGDGAGTLYVLKTSAGSEIAGKSFSFSIDEYLRKIINGTGYSSELVSFAKALEEYGTYAKAYFSGQEVSVSTAISAVNVSDVAGYERQVSKTAGCGLGYIGSSLMLLSDTSIRHYFSAAGENINDYEYYVDVTTANGGNRIRLTPQLKQGTNGIFYLEIRNISGLDFDKSYTITIKKNGSVVFTNNYSINSYIYSVLNDNGQDVSLAKLARAMYVYGKTMGTGAMAP